jgi:hypothetical protein
MSGPVIIVEVRQRVPGDATISRELGFFTDISMANQTIDWLYREVYKRVMQKDFVPDLWVTESVRQNIQIKGYNHWMVDDLNGGLPIFYTVEHHLYNQVPVVGGNFVMTVSENPLETGVPILP